MAHTKAGGSTRQKSNRRGKHLGVKVFGGQMVKVGNIIIRQHGSSVHPGDNVKMGGDFTLYALKDGIVSFGVKRGRKQVSVQTS